MPLWPNGPTPPADGDAEAGSGSSAASSTPSVGTVFGFANPARCIK
jgi:hypothetical protein